MMIIELIIVLAIFAYIAGMPAAFAFAMLVNKNQYDSKAKIILKSIIQAIGSWGFIIWILQKIKN